ncbi:MAG: phospholipid carrier-dependent glycosyltransferase, partial [Planctomycetes bacterium]|nr:phospholipid carrier-dependent glycosyltransferase [Planctomycetota bacterium]
DLRLLRLCSLPWALLALWATWRAARLLAPGQPGTSLGAAALLALTPQYQHLSGTITMDLMLAAFGSLALWQGVEWCVGERAPTRAAFAAGLCAGLACCVKINALVLVPALVLAGLCARASGRSGARAWLAALGGGLLAALPYYAWQWIESGHPLWSWHYQNVSPFHRPSPEALAVGGLEKWKWFVTVLWMTWLGDFGWTSVWFPGWANLLVAAVCAFGLATALRERGAGRAFLLGAAGLMLAAEVYFNLHFSQPQARHLYPFLPALVVPIALGLARLRALWPLAVAQLALSCWGLLLVAQWLRPPGWNDDPRWSATDDARRGALSAESIAWREVAAPRLEWAHPAGALDELVLAVENPSFEHRPWREHGYVFRSLADLQIAPAGELELPASFWAELQGGSRLYAQVVRLDSEGRAIARSPAREIRKP